MTRRLALTYDRDLIGYGANPPDPKWPGGARVAVNFVMNYEEGSEPSMQDGEGYTETGLTESSTSSIALKGPALAADAIRKSGFDVCCHGWRWVRHFQLSEAEEREHIQKAVTSLKQTVGDRPAGWYCRYGPSVNT